MIFLCMSTLREMILLSMPLSLQRVTCLSSSPRVVILRK